MKKVTAADIRALIESQIESEEPQTTMVNYLGSQKGKPLTERHAKELRKLTGDDSLWIRKQYGMTHINWGKGFGEEGGGSLLICWQEKNVLIPAKEELIERNSCYFSGAQIRNNRRRKVLEGDKTLLRHLAKVINNYNAVKEELYEKLLNYGGPFDADQWTIRKAFVDGENKE